MKTSMVQNNQTNFKGVKQVNLNTPAVKKYGKLVEQLAGVDEFKKPTIRIEAGAWGITTSLKGLFKSTSFYTHEADANFETVKKGIQELIANSTKKKK